MPNPLVSEAQVRAECASERIGMRDNIDALRERAERAKRERDAWKRFALADAGREAGDKALLRFIQSCIRTGIDLPLFKSPEHEAAHTLACQFRDTHYAPPAPPVVPEVMVPLDYVDASTIRITPEIARAIVALAQGGGDA
jgi:hypothetical protein